jgi:acetylxylan esterase
MLLASPCLVVLAAFAALGLGASLVQVKDFGGNPTKIYMYIYVPDKLAAKPAVVVAVSLALLYVQSSTLLSTSP